MASYAADNKILKQSLQTAIEVVRNLLECLQQREMSTTDTLMENAAVNNNINTFSINAADDERMKTLTNTLQRIFYDCLSTIPENYRQYIFNLLFEYHYDCQELIFKENLTMNSLHAFLNDLEAMRDSIDAFEAAWNGETLVVREFISKYPQFKDKPGLWGTTLLYSAARNNHIELIEYLITEADCSVDAQNQQHFERALGVETIIAPDYQVNPVAGSTSLHGACFHGHLAVVKYLVEHGADYYIKNQAEETPIMNIEHHADIREYFESRINNSYSERQDTLPELPIVEGGMKLKEDCIWEYKPLSENNWYPFESNESRELNKSLIVESDQQFKHEVYLNISSIVYTVSLSQFLRYAGNKEKNEDLAWIRCRGSSILNFDCYALWQILLTKHPQSNVTSVPCLKVFDLPTMDDLSFQIQLNTWYNCDAQTNSLLDKAMNNRRRRITTSINYVSDDELEIDMKTFSLDNKQDTISGFIRWIPKLVLTNEDNKYELKNIDNFQTLANSELTPLTTHRLKMSQVTSGSSVDQDEMYIDNGNENSDELPSNLNQDEALSIDEEEPKNTGQSFGNKQASLDTITNNNESFRSIIKEVTENETEVDADDYFTDTTPNTAASQQLLSPVEIPNSTTELEIEQKKLNELQNEKAKLDGSIELEQIKSLIGQSISGILTSPWTELRITTNQFLEQHPFTNEIEGLKNKALEEFIEQNISFQRWKFEKAPSQESVSIVKQFIDNIKTTLRSDQIHEDCEVQHFNMIPQLLQQIMIYYSCFKVQLPLFESSVELLDKIKNHTITTVATSTGSGKSTLLPALLIAEGYDKVIVTQPRRLPCKMISKRVNETIETDTGNTSHQLSGWAVSGDEHNPNAKILYLTDGLLKERLLYDEHFITNKIEVNKWIVFFIDEVHERSVNIDLCLALLARLLTMQPDLECKIKLIISSATLDVSVPRLFRQISNLEFTEFDMPQIRSPYRVKEIPRPDENILDIVQELYKKRQRNDQILCFVHSVTEVHQCCRLLAQLSRGTIIAYPLIQSQSSLIQEAYIEHGSVFFSTTVAETSLTFPSLKYVVDTGMVNIPIYNPESKRTILEQVRAAESTMKQRLGRLGRTRSGEYHYLYTFRVEDKRFPEPHIRLSDLTNIEFSLRRSPIKDGLDYMQQFLPDKLQQKAINVTIEELRKMSILEAAPSNQFTQHGKLLAKLPEFGSLAMAKAVLSALRKYNCGHDLICLASILSVLNTTAVLKDIPQNMKSPDGDFMTLLNIMNTVLLAKESVLTHKFNVQVACQKKGLENVAHIIGQAMKRYENLTNSFKLSQEYRQQAQVRSGKWKFIAKSLLAGYSDNVFVSMKELHERTHRFARYKDTNDIAILDLQSTLTRPISQAPVSVVLARDIRYTTAIRSTAILSFVGEIKPSWIEYTMQRNIEISFEEETHLKSKNIWSRLKSMFSNWVDKLRNKPIVSLSGMTGTVISDEFHLRKQMVTIMKFELENDCKQNTTTYDNLSKNLESVTKMTYIFNPMKWRWKAQKQVEITVNNNPARKTCEIVLEGRDSENQNAKMEFNSFLGWLARCAVIRHPNAGVLPRLLRPQMRKLYPNIEKRIARITDSERTMVDLYNAVKGTGTTRETRMEVVAWIAICKFHCKLEGGFVRDWVVGDYISRPAGLINNPHDWIEYKTNSNGQRIPYMHKEVVPADLDCHLPVHAYFDIDKFQDELHKFNIVCKVFREDWRYVLLIDEDKDVPTGPFTMDLIEPHVALTHDRIDFDVSNLSLEKDYPREIGMRIDITRSPYSIELETIVENIKNKRFQILRPIDKYVNERIQKMTLRQWTQHGEPMDYIPPPHPKHYSVLVPLPTSSTLYQALSQTMRKIGPIQILSIDEIKNPLLEDSYEAMKKIIAKQCKTQGYNPNEQKLFHGTHGPGINGHGAYFADDPRKSHDYTEPKGPNKARVMFYNKVTLGIISTQNAPNMALASAPQGFHSVKGTGFKYAEYIVYRYGQALPYLKITYKG
ncbi:unnamed protein product [Rotaria sordida]|uniref:PARP n=1 Tax=Rotaria sordida TaxID=392033 RepID=A0A814TKC8_9BILA|nr:unnamed protein product [Rotaria sordida]CAF1414899.1 unnamed protein product [Rotaria sordida]